MQYRGEYKGLEMCRRILFLMLFSVISGSYLFANEPEQSHQGHDQNNQEAHATSESHEHPEPGHEHCRIEMPKVDKEIMHHIADSHDWHLLDVPVGKCDLGHAKFFPVALPLPWLIYDFDKGIQFFGSTHGATEAGYEIHHGKLNAEASTAGLLDLSMSKTAFQILLVCILMFFVFKSVAKAYISNAGHSPKGMQSFFEPIIVFIREDIGKAYLGKKHEKFMPYLLTLFFFIWFANLLGLTPLNSNIAGNTSITIALALLSFILIMANSTKDFWMHIFWFPGVPLPLKPLMLVVEFMGLLTKPAALAIRLFANISAGHFMVLSLIGLIFILGKNGESIGGAAGGMALAIPFSLFIFSLEMIVALVQAYVFTLLTAVFIAQAMETHSHDHAEDHATSHQH